MQEDSDKTDERITLMPSKARQKEILKSYPQMVFVPLKIRFVKYEIDGQYYCLGTTLMDEQYTIEVLKGVYHDRWGIEELYKISKTMMEVNDFHGRSESAVKQELYAHFVLITMSRLSASASEHLLASLLNPGEGEPATEEHLETEPAIQVNFKNIISVFAQRLEEMLYAPWRYINQIITEVISRIARYYHKKREGRHFPRESRQPARKWSSRRSSA